MPQLEIDNASQTDSGVRRNLDAVPLGWPPQTRNNGQQVAQVAAMTTSDDNDGNGGALKLDIPAPIKASDEDSASIPQVSESSIEYMDPFKAILEQPSKLADQTPTPLNGAASNHNRCTLLIPQPKTPSIPQSSVPISKRNNFLHFNSKGEIIIDSNAEGVAEPIKPPALLQNPYPNPNVNIRICMKFGCASLIRTESKEAFCARCMEVGAVDLVSIAKSHARPLPASSLTANPYMPWVKKESQRVDINMELGYPEDLVVPSNAPTVPSQDTSEPPFTSAPLRPPPKVSQNARRLDASSGKKRHRLEVASQGHNLLPKPPMPPIPSTSTSSTLPPFVGTPARAVPIRRHGQPRNQYPPHPSQSGLKSCITPGCPGLIHVQSAAKRCTECVMNEWKGKAAKAKAKAAKEKALTRPKTPPPVAGPSSVAADPPSTPLADIISRAFQPPGSLSSTPTKVPKNNATANDSASKQKTCSAEENAHKRVFLRIPSKRKLEEMIDVTRNSSSPSPVKQEAPVEDSAKIEKKPLLMVTPMEEASPADVPPDGDAMDVDENSSKTTPPDLTCLPPSPKAKGKEKMKAMDVDKVNEISGWDSDLTSLSELERCGDTTDEEDEPANSKLVIRLPPRSYSHLPPEQRPNPPGTHYRVNGIGYGVLAAGHPTLNEEALPFPPKTTLPQVKVPPQELPPGTRRCAIANCKEPLAEGYKWKCCRSCRHHHREYQRKRLGIIKGSYSTLKEELKPEAPPSTVVVTNSQGTPVTLAAGSRICVIKNCGLVLPPVEEYKFKLCRECRKRTNKTRQRRQLRAEGKVDPELDKEIERMRARWKQRVAAQAVVVPVAQAEAATPMPPEAKPRTPAYPEYSALPLLVNDFSQRITGFLESQTLYVRHHHGPTADQQRMITFGFDGEYSVVAMDMDIEGRKEAIMDFVERVKAELERVGGLTFDSQTRFVSFQHGGILTRYACGQAVGPIVMRGELEIAILPEYTHRFFPGQRTVVRFRMVGEFSPLHATTTIPTMIATIAVLSLVCSVMAEEALPNDPYLEYRPAFARSLPVQILLTGVVLTLVAVLFIHLIFTAQYHWPLAPVNYVLQMSGVTTLLISLIATLHVVLAATLEESQIWPYMLSYIAVNVPPLDGGNTVGWSTAERATWLIMNATTSGLIQITHIQFLTLLYPSKLEGRLVFSLLGPLAILAAIMQLLPINGSPKVNEVASAIKNVCNATLSLLFTVSLCVWGILVNRKQAWRTDGGTAVFGGAALVLAVVSTALNFLYIPREEEYVWLPGLMWAVVLWQSFLGWWWWVGAGSGTGLHNYDESDDIEKRRERKREKRKRRGSPRGTRERAHTVWRGVAGAFGSSHSDEGDSTLRHRSPTLTTTHSRSRSPHPDQPHSTQSDTSLTSTGTLPRILPAAVHRWYASLRQAHLTAARKQAMERAERIRELERAGIPDSTQTGWGLGSFAWRTAPSRHQQQPRVVVAPRFPSPERFDEEEEEDGDEQHPEKRPAPPPPAAQRSVLWWGPLSRWRLQDSTVY